jgi:hypothetical protein
MPDDVQEEAPPLADHRWHAWTRPLLALLARPRRWSRMLEWASGAGVNEGSLRQLASALEEFGEAESLSHGGSVVWRRKLERERDWICRAPSPV